MVLKRVWFENHKQATRICEARGKLLSSGNKGLLLVTKIQLSKPIHFSRESVVLYFELGLSI